MFEKIIMSIKSKNKGKSGGARLIIYNIIVSDVKRTVLLVTIFDKSEEASITYAEIKRIIKNCGFN
jgi:hypothetical protein